MQAVAVRCEPDVARVRAAYERCHARLWRALLAWSGSPDVADEAAAEAFAQALRRGAAIDDVEAWVWRAAFRIAGGELARRGAAGLTASVPDLGQDDGWAPSLEGELLDALRSLSAQQRACVVLRDVGGLSVGEVAAALGTSPGTVRVQHLAGRRRLRRTLGDSDA